MSEERLVMGFWDCPYCDRKEIQGTMRNCPGCGRPRGDTKCYMKSRNHEEVVKNGHYLTEEQAKTKGKGADWICAYCDCSNSVLDKVCKSCGHARDEGDTNYFTQKKQPVRPAATPPKSSSGGFFDLFKNKKFLAVALACVLIIGLIVSFAMPKTKAIKVIDKEWEYNIEVEKYKQVEDSDWSLPKGAELIRTANEIRRYDHVIDHYETKTRTYTERVPDGSHTEYTYSDNGDGTFTEHAHTVQDYRNETRTETYEEPVYRDVPVYDTKYYFKEWRWVHERDVKTKGVDETPYYGEVTLQDKEREGAKTETYFIKATIKGKDESKLYKIEKGNWEAIRSGSSIKVKIKSNEIVEIVENEKG